MAAKPVANIIKSTRPKPLSTGQLQQGQVTFYDKIGDAPNNALSNNWQGRYGMVQQPKYQPPVQNGSFSSVIGKNMNAVKLPNESHEPKGYREEGKLDQPGDNFRFDYVVAIPTTRKLCGEEVTIEFDGGEHSKDSSGKDLPRDGDKIGFPICTGAVRYARQYDEGGKHKYDYHYLGDGAVTGNNVVLQKGSTYGIRITNSLSSNGRIMEGYVQNLSTGGPLQKIITVQDTGQFPLGVLRYQPGWRIGPRIDGKNDANEPLYTKGMTLS